MISGIQARTFPQDEFSIYLLSGFTQLRYGSAFTSEGKFGGGGGVSYSRPVNRYWDVVGGVELFYYHSVAKAGRLTSSAYKVYNDYDYIEPMYYNCMITDYTEQQHITYLQVPLTMRYKIQAFGNHKFYAAAGVKAGYSMVTNYSGAMSQMTTSGYFPDSEELFPNMPNHGFDTFYNLSSKGSMTFKTGNISLTLETGLRWTLTPTVSLYTGVFFDYGILEIGLRHSKTNQPLVSLDEINNDFIFRSILSSRNQLSGKAYVDKLGLLAVGLKINLTFNGLFRKSRVCICP
jgi:hypothetical protein